ncbi:MAG: Ppx/GppA phosphatase family protein [Pseudomonadota bacterium]|nr:Ppx/GppA phosphatase family protein [Pseudomonadota bacterium]
MTVNASLKGQIKKKRSSSRRRKNRSEAPRTGLPVIAALDLGTNNCRLMIAQSNYPNFRVVDGYSKAVRLGEGLVFSGRLSEEAIARTLSTLRICKKKIFRRGVSLGRYVATEACRQAINGEEFLLRVKEEIGLNLEIISSEEETKLTINGCFPLLRESSQPFALTFDVGGGSAEITLVDLKSGSPVIHDWVSVPHGVVTLTERYQASNISAFDYQKMVCEIRDALVPFERKHHIGEKISEDLVQVLGTAGTVTTIAGIHMELKKYDRTIVDGSWLDLSVIQEISQQLVSSTFDERAALACIGRGRAELVVAGCAVLQAICELWPAKRIRVADRGIREGILLSLARDISEKGQNFRNGKK